MKAATKNWRLCAFHALALVSIFAASQAAGQEYKWSGALSVSGTTASGSVNGVGYTITSTGGILTSPGMFNVAAFSDTYKIPGDTGGGANVTVMREQTGSNYTLTFDRPVEQPLVAIASLGNPSTPTTFNFGSSVEILWSSAVTANNGTLASTTSVRGSEGFLVAKYSGTISSITFGVPVGEIYMNLLMGFEVSTVAPTITAPGGVAGASTAAISVDELQTAVGDWEVNKAANWSITGGADSSAFSINSSTGVLSFRTAPDYLSPTDSGADNTYEVTVRATDLQGVPQNAEQTVTVTVTDATNPSLSSSSPADNATGVGVNANIVLNFSEVVVIGSDAIAIKRASDDADFDAFTDAIVSVKERITPPEKQSAPK